MFVYRRVIVADCFGAIAHLIRQLLGVCKHQAAELVELDEW